MNTNRRNRNLLFLFCLPLIFSCSIHGYYSSVPNPNSIALAGYEIILNKNKDFEIRSWTDVFTTYSDSLGNRIWKDPHYQGVGTFEQVGDSLHLYFQSEDSITVEIIKTFSDDNAFYSVSFINEIGVKSTPIISLRNKNGALTKVIGINNPMNHTSFDARSFPDVHSFGFDLYYFRSRFIDIQLSDIKLGKNRFKFKTYNGYYPKGSKTKLYVKRSFSGIRHGDRQRWLAKKHKWAWLNKFYN